METKLLEHLHFYENCSYCDIYTSVKYFTYAVSNCLIDFNLNDVLLLEFVLGVIHIFRYYCALSSGAFT